MIVNICCHSECFTLYVLLTGAKVKYLGLVSLHGKGFIASNQHEMNYCL